MALMKDGLWAIVNKTEARPAADQAEKLEKFIGRWDKALAIIVLSIDPALLYLVSDPIPTSPIDVWKALLGSV